MKIYKQTPKNNAMKIYKQTPKNNAITINKQTVKLDMFSCSFTSISFLTTSSSYILICV
jgi:hypothetical protein